MELTVTEFGLRMIISNEISDHGQNHSGTEVFVGVAS